MALPVILAVTLHEVAHGYVAWIRGDDTAKRMGRITLNPIAHVHWFGTIVLPIMFYMASGFLFAFAKPVPVNFGNLKNPKQDMVLVAAAGPVTNLILAVISALILKIIIWADPNSFSIAFTHISNHETAFTTGTFIVPVIYMLHFSVLLNIVLAVINLIPVPPADGGRIMTGLLPDQQAIAYAKVEPYGFFILIFVLFYNPMDILNWTIYPAIGWILQLLL
jgi:Zn-dependent protease